LAIKKKQIKSKHKIIPFGDKNKKQIKSKSKRTQPSTSANQPATQPANQPTNKSVFACFSFDTACCLTGVIVAFFLTTHKLFSLGGVLLPIIVVAGTDFFSLMHFVAQIVGSF
jgi:hypothetical protein